jgi:hypothetical protein
VNDYEGLNLPQLLELMHELVVPPPVSLVPEGPGWWVLGAWVLGVLAILARTMVVHRRRNRYRREAALLLDDIAADADRDPAQAAGRIATVLKQAALAAYPRAEVAGLYGDDWASFLSTSAGNDPVVEEASAALASAAWRKDADGRELISPARRWIRLHRA